MKMLKKTFCLALSLLMLTALLILPAGADDSVERDSDYIVDSVLVRKLYQIPNHVENHVMQGLAAHNGTIFQCYDGGRCATYQLTTGERIAEFRLGSFIESNHCGNANFGFQYPEGNTEFPALYVSGDLTTKACYVENVTTTSAELIQTIYFDIQPSTYTGGQVILDKARNRIVYMQREKRSIGDYSNVFRMCEFPIPDLSAGAEIHFTNEDMLCDPYTLPFYSSTYQGAYIYGNTLLQTYGYNAANAFGSTVGVMCFDTETHDFTRAISLTGLVDKEPQGIFVYEGRLIMNFVNGEVYEVFPQPALIKTGYEITCAGSADELKQKLAAAIETELGIGFAVKDIHLADDLSLNSTPTQISAEVTLQTPYNDIKTGFTATVCGHSCTSYKSNRDATCSANGTKTAICDRDDCKVFDTVEDHGSMLTHIYGESVTVQKASVGKSGTAERTCGLCGDKITKAIPPLDPHAHSLSTLEIVLICAACVTVSAAVTAAITVFICKKKRE